MRKIAAFYADTHREAQAVLKHIDGDVLEKMDFYLDAVGCRENPEEHSCEYAFREFCYGSPKTKKQLVIHDFVAPMDKEIVVPSLYILPFSHSYSVFRSFSKQQDCLMLGFFDISCQKPQAGAICAYSKQNVVP